MKAIYLLSGIILLMIGAGCDREKEPEKPMPPSTELIKTWRLVGFAHTVDSTVKEVEKTCQTCYSLTFTTEGKLFGRSSSCEITGSYKLHNDGITLEIICNQNGEHSDGKRYIETLRKITHYEIVSGQLKLYEEDDGENYLLFRERKESDKDSVLNKIPAALFGRTWRLLGFGERSNYTVREANPIECKKCYTLTFLKDGTIKGYTSSREITGVYKAHDGMFMMSFFKIDETDESSKDGREYVRALGKVSEYFLSSNRLTLYYNNQMAYLLFCDEKDIPDRPTPMPSGTWKLIGFGNTADASVKDVEPKDCATCYTISFLKDGTITGQTATNEIKGIYKINGYNLTLNFSRTKVKEVGHGERYINALLEVAHFEINHGELKLHYGNKGDYLLFSKKIRINSTPVNVRKIKFQLQHSRTKQLISNMNQKMR